MLFKETGLNWNYYPIKFKRGIGCYKKDTEVEDEAGNKIVRSKWFIDEELPILSKDQDFLRKILEIEAKDESNGEDTKED